MNAPKEFNAELQGNAAIGMPPSPARELLDFNRAFAEWLPTEPPPATEFFGLDRSGPSFLDRPAPRRSWWLRLRVWIASRVLRVAVDG